MTTPALSTTLRSLIARNELPAALGMLRELLDLSPKLDEAIQQSARFENLREQIRQGTVALGEANTPQLRAALLDFVRELETQDETPPNRSKMESATSIVKSKNAVVGNVSAGRDVHFGDKHDHTHYHHAENRTPPKKLLTAPGADVPGSFLGRTEEIAKIRALLTARQRPLGLVNAEGGMGKTTLAAYYWREFQHEYRHMAWLFCESGIVSAMLSQLPQPLGIVDDMAEALRQAVATNTPGENAQWQTLKNAMANLDQPCLLVLDNANEAEEIRRFLQKAKGLHWHILLTSRCAKVMPDADSEYTIAGLPPDLAKALFKSNHDEATPDFEQLLDRFLTAVGYNTLCIEVFSKNLAEGREWGLDMRGLLEKLETTGLFLEEGSFEVRADWTDNTQRPSTHTTTDDIIAALYNVAGLEQTEPELHALLATLALLPAEKHPTAILRELLPTESPAALKRQLDQLVRKGWLSQAEGAYRISPVVQKIVLRLTTPKQRWHWAEPMVRCLHDIFEVEGTHPKNIATAASFAELIFGLVDNIALANGGIITLFDRLWVFRIATGNLSQALMCAEKMGSVSNKYDDKNGLAISYAKLGETHRALGNLPQALTFFKQSSKLSKALYQDYPQNVEFKLVLAISYQLLGHAHTASGNFLQALTLFKQYSKLSKELHDSNPLDMRFKNGLAISYAKLGETYSILGNLRHAKTFFEKYNKLSIEMHELCPQNVEFKNNLAISCQFLGNTHMEMGDLPKALTFFEDQTKLFEELYEAYPQDVRFKNGLSVSFSKLGEAHSALENLSEALKFYEKFNQVSKKLYVSHPQNVEFKNGLAVSYYKLGEIKVASEDKPKAKDYFQQAEALWAELVRNAPEYAHFQQSLDVVRKDLSALN